MSTICLLRNFLVGAKGPPLCGVFDVKIGYSKLRSLNYLWRICDVAKAFISQAVGGKAFNVERSAVISHKMKNINNLI